MLIGRLGNTGISVLIVLIIIVLIVDTSIVDIATSTGGLRSSPSDIASFVFVVMVYAVGQYIILSFIKYQYEKKDVIGGLKTNLRLIGKIVTISQYVLLGILVSTIFQMIFTMSYHIIVLRAAILVSYGISMILLGLLAKRFFSWFRSNRNLVVLVYALATTTLSINNLITIIYINNALNNDPLFITPVRSLTGSFTESDLIFNSAYVLTSVSSFILTWIATVLLLRHYSRKLGKTKYWIAVSIPLAYFLSQFQPLFLYSFSDFRLSDPVLFGFAYNLFFAISKPLGGLLFGIAFWSVARGLTDELVKRYMIFSAFGMMLLFTANQPTGLVLVPYPPFGLATICFMGLTSYLVFVGIYAASLSVSQDSKLRQSIRKTALRESQFLDVIGTAEMEQEIERRVMYLTAKTKNSMLNETGISPSLDENDIRYYIQQVLEEVKGKDKGKANNNGS